MGIRMQVVEIYTDGACRGNPGPGGWGAVLRCNQHEKHLKGAEAHTTNNRMELSAAIAGLSALKKASMVSVTTDSQYVRKGVLEWMPRWKVCHWQTADKQPVKNKDLWLQLDSLLQSHTITWHWVKGHSGHPENELADKLANEAIDELLKKDKTA